MNDQQLIQKLSEANITFTPGSPINSKDLFADRLGHVVRVVETITRPGQHAIMFGERGVGKTSLANVIHEFLPQSRDFFALKENCSSGLSFTELWRSVFRQMQLKTIALGQKPENDEIDAVVSHFIDQDNPVKITPNDVRFVLAQFPTRNIILIIDEFDRITNEEDISKMVDTIKTLSDHTVPITIVLVAVADSVGQLIKEHESLSRALVQIPLPRMSQGELGQIIEKGMTRLGMSMNRDVSTKIVELSQGLPHYTHLLALEATSNAIKEDKIVIDQIDLKMAIDMALKKTQESTRQAYYSATTAARGKLYPTVLLGCAMAKTNERGYFSPTDVAKALCEQTGEDFHVARFTRHLREFATEKRGSILVESGSKGQYKYRFRDPMMQPYLVLKAISEGKKKEEKIY